MLSSTNLTITTQTRLANVITAIAQNELLSESCRIKLAELSMFQIDVGMLPTHTQPSNASTKPVSGPLPTQISWTSSPITASLIHSLRPLTSSNVLMQIEMVASASKSITSLSF